MSKTFSIGCGSASAIDRLGPGIALAGSGLVEAMSFDCLSERTLPLAHVRRRNNPDIGQDERLPDVMDGYAEFLRDGKPVVGNFGAANPDAAVADVVAGLRRTGNEHVKVGVVRGDDVRDLVVELDSELPEMGVTVGDVRSQVVAANAYLGAEPIVDLLEQGAGFVLGGRIADPSLFVAPICHAMGWAIDDWDRVATATLAGHLLECNTYSTGGGFSDPPYRVVPNAHDLGSPMAIVGDDSTIVTKLEGTGGMVDGRTIRCQLSYEVHDPAAYLTPDVTADFTQVEVDEVGPDRVRVRGARGRARPESLKVLVGLDLGWKAVAEMSFGGPGCIERAEDARQTIEADLAPVRDQLDAIRFDLIGSNSLFEDAVPGPYPVEVRLRVAARTRHREVAEHVAGSTEFLLFVGPSGGGGASKSVTQVIGVTPAYVERRLVDITGELVTP